MGACLSSTGDSIHKSTCAFVISNEGELRQYPTPIFVSEVLQLENPSSFICNSDNLYYDENVIPLSLEEELDAGQIYFILPKTMLSRRLSASDMATLAVKASTSLDSGFSSSSRSSSNTNSQKRMKNKARISPMVLLETSQVNVVVEEENEIMKHRQQRNNGNGSLRVSRSGSKRKIKKARLAAVRSFRLRLSTIYENEGCDELQVC